MKEQEGNSSYESYLYRMSKAKVKKKSKIISAFCGTGKTYICDNVDVKSIEVEYWKYQEQGLSPNRYLQDIKNKIGKFDYIFISTDPIALRFLIDEGLDITLVYPENSLRGEYLDRYIERDSPYDFIGTFMKFWNIWLDELKEQDCNHIVLSQGQYLQDILEKLNERGE